MPLILETPLAFYPLIWMLPLGLLLIAQDVPLLEEPLLKTFAWVEVKWHWLKLKWQEG